MNRRQCLIFGFVLATSAQSATADTRGPLALVPNARKVGGARLKIMLMPVFDLTLYGPQGQWHAEEPFALRVDYLRALNGRAMAQHAADEISHQGFGDTRRLTAWQTQLKAILPDVLPGDSMTAVRDSTGATLFFKDKRSIGRIADTDFGRHFFAICLAPETSRPDLRRGLLGQG